MNRERTGATVGYKNVGEFTAYGVSTIEFTAYEVQRADSDLKLGQFFLKATFFF